jgi:glycerol kinase
MAETHEVKVQVFDNVLKEDYLKNFTPIKNKKKKKKNKENPNKLVGAIDQGTSSTRFVVFTTKGRIAASSQMEHTQIFPESNAGWHEHDPVEIFRNTATCIQATLQALERKSYAVFLSAVGITNQRETTIAWNRVTGVPYYNAIVWDDTRTTGIAKAIAQGNSNRLRDQTGLPLASYFAGTKVKWLLDNVEALRKDLEDDAKSSEVCFGTIDSWLVYQLTGTKSNHDGAINSGGVFVTDATNASRWLFMDLAARVWDQTLVNAVCAPHRVPLSALPEICPSSHVYATCKGIEVGVPGLDKVPLAAILGDQQAALFGQTAFAPGEAKNTYGTGLFLMMNTGTKIVPSKHGLLTTVAYQIGQNAPVQYALEGSVSHSGSTIQWLRDQLQIIKDAPESETMARTCDSNQGLYFVPAFSGLFAPHWRSDARACIVGMTASHHRGHVCRAALEAAAYQTHEVFAAIEADSNVTLRTLNVDGGGTHNQLLMQFQADIIGVPVVKPAVMETTSMGAAFAAGLAVGIWQDQQEIKELWTAAQTFNPKMDVEERDSSLAGWRKAVSKSLDWVDEDQDAKKEDGLVAMSDESEHILNEAIASSTHGVANLSLKTEPGNGVHVQSEKKDSITIEPEKVKETIISKSGDSNQSADQVQNQADTRSTTLSENKANLLQDRVAPPIMVASVGAAAILGFLIGRGRRI